jgi:hypothetical protein
MQVKALQCVGEMALSSTNSKRPLSLYAGEETLALCITRESYIEAVDDWHQRSVKLKMDFLKAHALFKVNFLQRAVSNKYIRTVQLHDLCPPVEL